MAERADAERIDKEELNEALPSEWEVNSHIAHYAKSGLDISYKICFSRSGAEENSGWLNVLVQIWSDIDLEKEKVTRFDKGVES